MLKSKPIGADEVAFANSNRMTIEILKAFWQKVSPHLTIEAGDEASYNEWEDKYGHKNQGMRMPDGARHGIVRMIVFGHFIEEATFYEDKPHGLSFTWYNDPTIAFRAFIFDHGQLKAVITWNKDWSEAGSLGDKQLILENNGLSIFKP